MPKIKYKDINLSAPKLAVIAQANRIIDEYEAQGLELTLRQLYYQFVARDLIQNKQTEYKRLGSIIVDGRMAGLIDWNRIVDMTRNLHTVGHWGNPASIVRACAYSYNEDMWAGQTYRPEVWIEKDALVGVIQRPCAEYDVPYFSCRGYTSISEIWAAAQRLQRYINAGQTPIILHFGDHDPSGMDMTRDIDDRLITFMGGVQVQRLALNIDQIREYNPPPNFAKITDSRAKAYMDEFGDDSWELDALNPTVMSELITNAITGLIDQDPWNEAKASIERGKAELTAISDNYRRIVTDYLGR